MSTSPTSPTSTSSAASHSSPDADSDSQPPQSTVRLRVLRHDVTDSQITQIKRYQDFSTIDWVEDAAQENKIRTKSQIHPSRWVQLYTSVQGWLVLALVGAAIGLIAAFLSIVTEWASDLKSGYCSSAFYLNEDFCCSGYEGGKCPEWKRWTPFSLFNYFIYITISTGFAVSAAILVATFAPYAAGSGISEIKCIISGFIMKGFLSAKTLAIKSFTLPLAIASGLSVGKEGPSVHYAACVGNVIAKLFPRFRHHNSRLREVLCSCTAAGVAVAFGSPMGGVLFALEEMSSSFSLKTMWRSYFCALVATGVLASVNPFRTGQLVLFSVKYDHNWHYFELIFFVIIGLFGGFGGLLIIKWNLRAQAFRKKYLANFAVTEIAVLAMITSVVCYFNQFLRIDMTESMGILFHECSPEWDHMTCNPSNRTRIIFSLIIAIIIRMFLTIISYGSRVPAGIFVPSMAIGALFGRLVGSIAWALYDRYPTLFLFASCQADTPCITPGTYALLGSAALLSGVMHITVTVVIIMFEVTGALTYILPTMIVVGVTKAVCDIWGLGGIADRSIISNGFPFIDGSHWKESDVVANEPVELAMTVDPTVIRDGMTITEVKYILSLEEHDSYPVVGQSNNMLLGYIWRSDLDKLVDQHGESDPDKYCRFDRSVASSASSSTVTFSSPTPAVSPSKTDDLGYLNYVDDVKTNMVCVVKTFPINRMVDIFSKAGPRLVYVTHDGELCGLLTKKDLLRHHYKTEYVLSPPNTTAAEELDRKLWQLIERAGAAVTGTTWSNITQMVSSGYTRLRAPR